MSASPLKGKLYYLRELRCFVYDISSYERWTNEQNQQNICIPCSVRYSRGSFFGSSFPYRTMLSIPYRIIASISSKPVFISLFRHSISLRSSILVFLDLLAMRACFLSSGARWFSINCRDILRRFVIISFLDKNCAWRLVWSCWPAQATLSWNNKCWVYLWHIYSTWILGNFKNQYMLNAWDRFGLLDFRGNRFGLLSFRGDSFEIRMSVLNATHRAFQSWPFPAA